jgi:two-component system, cell cycle response regulator
MRVLFADDDVVLRHIVLKRLQQWGYDVHIANDGEEAWAVLQGDDPPRLAVLDWMMPRLDGFEIVQRIRARGNEPYIYTLLLTSRSEQEDLIQAMEAGADDYVIKPFDPHELKVRLRAGQRIVELQQDLITAREALRVQATRDALTGIWNRAAIFDQLHRDLARAGRELQPIGVCMADIDHFKAVNDTLGHHAGDLVLREVALRMASKLRPYDSIGRYGGEEFLVVLPGCSRKNAAAVAERLRAQVAASPVDTTPPRRVTVSFGVAAIESGERVSVEALLRDADAALYLAKARGRDRVELARVPDTIAEAVS